MCVPLYLRLIQHVYVCMHVCLCVRGNGKGNGTCLRVDLPFFLEEEEKTYNLLLLWGKGERHHSLLLLLLFHSLHHSSKKSSSESVFMALSLPALALPSPPSYRSSSSMLSLLRSNMILVSLLFCCSLETPFRI